eukprot:GHVS01096208.1.p2 GENE.GHVS01096208.1~~GHVS01096208.1.p2  ORF type:complete len:476 (+),score=102.19 GHVS01096208.1:1703-3130(+)
MRALAIVEGSSSSSQLPSPPPDAICSPRPSIGPQTRQQPTCCPTSDVPCCPSSTSAMEPTASSCPALLLPPSGMPNMAAVAKQGGQEGGGVDEKVTGEGGRGGACRGRRRSGGGRISNKGLGWKHGRRWMRGSTQPGAEKLSVCSNEANEEMIYWRSARRIRKLSDTHRARSRKTSSDINKESILSKSNSNYETFNLWTTQLRSAELHLTKSIHSLQVKHRTQPAADLRSTVTHIRMQAMAATKTSEQSPEESIARLTQSSSGGHIQQQQGGRGGDTTTTDLTTPPAPANGRLTASNTFNTSSSNSYLSSKHLSWQKLRGSSAVSVETATEKRLTAQRPLTASYRGDGGVESSTSLVKFFRSYKTFLQTPNKLGPPNKQQQLQKSFSTGLLSPALVSSPYSSSSFFGTSSVRPSIRRSPAPPPPPPPPACRSSPVVATTKNRSRTAALRRACADLEDEIALVQRACPNTTATTDK